MEEAQGQVPLTGIVIQKEVYLCKKFFCNTMVVKKVRNVSWFLKVILIRSCGLITFYVGRNRGVV